MKRYQNKVFLFIDFKYLLYVLNQIFCVVVGSDFRTCVVVFELVFEEFDFELFLADVLEDDEGGGHQDEDGYDSGG